MIRSLTIMSALLALVALSSGASLADTQKARALNALRASHGLNALGYSAALEAAAAHHARDMLQSRSFSHTGSDGSSVGQRVRRAGYRWCFVAENLAQGQRDLAQVLEAWAASPGHRANMLSREVTEFALVQADGYIWVMVLARPGC